MSATYTTRSNDIESSVVARGDLWRLEASRGGSTSGNDTSPLYLVQLGPLLFVRDSTLLLPVHLSKQHLLWYGYDRKVLILCIALSQSVHSWQASSYDGLSIIWNYTVWQFFFFGPFVCYFIDKCCLPLCIGKVMVFTFIRDQILDQLYLDLQI